MLHKGTRGTLSFSFSYVVIWLRPSSDAYSKNAHFTINLREQSVARLLLVDFRCCDNKLADQLFIG